MAQPVKKQVKVAAAPKPVIFNFSFKTKCYILCVICALFYGNSITNKYALDDSLVIERNDYVKEGFKGIPKILLNDSYASFYTEMGGSTTKEVSGGRYRPLAEVFFAVEQQFFSDDTLPYVRHFMNIIGYMACMIAILFFLENFLLKKIPWGADMAFFISVLFIMHPIHTEVVANIKSFDILLSVFFTMLTFIYGLRYLKSKKITDLVIGCVSFFLTLLAKENGFTLVFFIPFVFYLLTDKNPVSAVLASMPYYVGFVAYMGLRYVAVGFHQGMPSTDILTNPYMNATHIQKIATEWFVLGKYIVLLFFPYPLSSDYSYNQIAYHNLADITVILPMLIYTALTVWGVILALKKNILSFAILFFLLNIFMISNFVIDIAGTMGERLVFHSSLGLLIILCFYLFQWLAKKPLQTKKNVLIGIASVLGVVCLGETVVRNAQWKDDTSLFIHDVNIVPRSALVNNNAAWGYLSLSEEKGNTVEQARAYLDSSYKYSIRALKINPIYEAAYLNLGGVYFHWGLSGEKPSGLDSAKYCWDMVEKIHPNHPSLKAKFALLCQYYFEKGIGLGKTGNPRAGIVDMKKALSLDTANSDIWYNIGGAYFTVQQYDSARYAWMKALYYKPDNMDAKRGLQALPQQNK